MDNSYSYQELRALKKVQQDQKDKKYLEESKERLKKIVTKKLQTVMIGSISSIEKNLGFLFGFSNDGQDVGKQLTPEEIKLRDIFMEIRKEILDLGNKQIKGAETEINQHDIKWNRYQLTLPVKMEGQNDGE